MKGFIEWLEGLNEKDTKVRAVLRRSLSFEPGSFAQAYPYVEPFIRSEEIAWRREAFYLVAGLWAMHWRQDRAGETMPIGKACAAHQKGTNSASTERRFIAMLDSDTGQLPYRLRQMVALLKDYSIDFESILKGLFNWTDDERRTQTAWARDFYRTINVEIENINGGQDK